MGRLVMFLGIVLLIVGAAGVVFGFVGIPAQFTSSIMRAVTPTAAELCNPGETLDEELGGEEYTALEGYRRSVQYYCVNDAGVRRPVTGSFVTGMFSDVFNSLGIMLIPGISGCILTVGILLTVVGTLFSRRRRLSAAGNFNFPEQQVFVTTTRVPRGQVSRTVSAASAGAFAEKLRQLEEARISGMISEDEYQRLRQELLDNLS